MRTSTILLMTSILASPVVLISSSVIIDAAAIVVQFSLIGLGALVLFGFFPALGD